MEFRGPSRTPSIGQMLDDLPTKDLARVARHLGISARTLSRYQQSGNAPRLAHLALFWETQWGLGLVACHAQEGQRIALAWAHSLERETAMLRTRIARLEELGDFGAANSPLWASR